MRKIFLFLSVLLFSCLPMAANNSEAHYKAGIIPAFSFLKDNMFLTFSSIDDRRKDNPILKRTPAAYSLLPKAWIEEMSLMLQGVVTIEHLYYEILDAENTTVQSGYVDIRKNETLSIGLGNLATGSYTLLLTIGDDTYAADFDMIYNP